MTTETNFHDPLPPKQFSVAWNLASNMGHHWATSVGLTSALGTEGDYLAVPQPLGGIRGWSPALILMIAQLTPVGYDATMLSLSTIAGETRVTHANEEMTHLWSVDSQGNTRISILRGPDLVIRASVPASGGLTLVAPQAPTTEEFDALFTRLEAVVPLPFEKVSTLLAEIGGDVIGAFRDYSAVVSQRVNDDLPPYGG